MLDTATKLEIRPELNLWVEFSDGVSGIVDLSKRAKRGIFAPLADPSFFAQARIDEFCVVCWPNGADIAPDAVHDELSRNNGLWVVGVQSRAAA